MLGEFKSSQVLDMCVCVPNADFSVNLNQINAIVYIEKIPIIIGNRVFVKTLQITKNKGDIYPK